MCVLLVWSFSRIFSHKTASGSDWIWVMSGPQSRSCRSDKRAKHYPLSQANPTRVARIQSLRWLWQMIQTSRVQEHRQCARPLSSDHSSLVYDERIALAQSIQPGRFWEQWHGRGDESSLCLDWRGGTELWPWLRLYISVWSAERGSTALVRINSCSFDTRFDSSRGMAYSDVSFVVDRSVKFRGTFLKAGHTPSAVVSRILFVCVVIFHFGGFGFFFFGRIGDRQFWRLFVASVCPQREVVGYYLTFLQ